MGNQQSHLTSGENSQSVTVSHRRIQQRQYSQGNSQSPTQSELPLCPMVSPCPMGAVFKNKLDRSGLEASMDFSCRNCNTSNDGMEHEKNHMQQCKYRNGGSLSPHSQHQSQQQQNHRNSYVVKSFRCCHHRHPVKADIDACSNSINISKQDFYLHQCKIHGNNQAKIHSNCVNKTDLHNLYGSSTCARNDELVKDGNKEMLVPITLSTQISSTESSVEEMTEADRNGRFVHNEVLCNEVKLVERGGSFEPKTHKGEVRQTTSNRTENVHNGDVKLEGQFRMDESSEMDTCGINSSSFTNTATRDSYTDISSAVHTPVMGINNTTNTLPVYLDPRTGECHSLVFGSINGEGVSMMKSTGVFSETHSSANSCTMSFGTEPFSKLSSRDFNSDKSNFESYGQGSVFIGSGDPFDSFSHNRQSISAVPVEGSIVHDSVNVFSSQDLESSWQNDESQKQPQAYSNTTDINYASQHRQIPAISICESCDMMEARSVSSFGSHGKVCQLCSIHSQSYGAESCSFTAMSSSVYKSQDRPNSWGENVCGLDCVNSQTCVDSWGVKVSCSDKENCCYYCDNKSHDIRNNSKNCEHVHSCCKCIKMYTEDERFETSGVTKSNIDDCEIATEGFGVGDEMQQTQPVLKFGGAFPKHCQHILESQLLAEMELRGADTGEFSDNSTDHSAEAIGVLTCSELKTDTASHSVENESVKEAVASCHGQKPLVASNFDTGTKVKSKNSSQCSSPRQNNPCSVLSGAKILPKFPETDTSDKKVDYSEKHSSDWCSKQPSDRGHKDEHFCPFRLNSGGSNSLWRSESSPPGQTVYKDDCFSPFRQNYVAYLCCAPEDLSDFGLSFHRLLESWGYRIFIAPRDLELTGPKYENMTRWLEERCNGKIIVILSKNYIYSDECLFLTYFARTLDPDSRNRNIIPVMIDSIEIPNVLKGLSIIKYNYDVRCGWLKSKLANAIAA